MSRFFHHLYSTLNDPEIPLKELIQLLRPCFDMWKIWSRFWGMKKIGDFRALDILQTTWKIRAQDTFQNLYLIIFKSDGQLYHKYSQRNSNDFISIRKMDLSLKRMNSVWYQTYEIW